MHDPVLTDIRKKTIALSYLCGVSPGYAKLRWKLGTSGYIQVAHRSDMVICQDPLVRFYRESIGNDSRKSVRAKRRLRNSAHFYLSLNRSGIDKSYLVKNNLVMDPVYAAIMEDIYRPRMASASRSLLLAKEKPPLAAVLRDVFDDRAATILVEEVLMEILPELYGKRDGFDRNELEELLKEFVFAIDETRLRSSPVGKFILYAIDTELEEHENRIVKISYGIEDGVPKSVNVVSAITGMTVTGVLQIKDASIRKLRVAGLKYT